MAHQKNQRNSCLAYIVLDQHTSKDHKYKFGVTAKGYHGRVQKCDHQEHFLRLIGETQQLFVTNNQHKPQIFSFEAGGRILRARTVGEILG